MKPIPLRWRLQISHSIILKAPMGVMELIYTFSWNAWKDSNEHAQKDPSAMQFKLTVTKDKLYHECLYQMQY